LAVISNQAAADTLAVSAQAGIPRWCCQPPWSLGRHGLFRGGAGSESPRLDYGRPVTDRNERGSRDPCALEAAAARSAHGARDHL